MNASDLDINIPHVEPNVATANIVNAAIGIAGVVAVAFIIYAGIIFATSAGDAGKVAKARHMMIYSIAGLVIVLLAFAIVNFVLKNI